MGKKPKNPKKRIAAAIKPLISTITAIVSLVSAITALLGALQKFFEKTTYSPQTLMAIAIISLAVSVFAGVFGWLKVRASRKADASLQTSPQEIGRGRRLMRPLVKGSALVLLVGLGIAGARVTWNSQARYYIRSWWYGPKVELTSPPSKRLELGINLPWLNYGHDFGAVPGWTWDGASRNEANVRRRFEDLKQSGVDHVVWFLMGDGVAAPALDDHGYPKEPDASFWADYDAAIRIARETDVGIVWVLLDHLALKPSDPKTSPRKGGLAALVVDRDKRRIFFEKVLNKLVERYFWERSIVGWVVVNEPEHAVKEGHVDQGSMDEFLVEAATLIRKKASKQPVAIGHADLESMVAFATRFPDASDFLVFHEYGHVPPPSVEHLRAILGRQRSLEKWKAVPVYIGEYDGDAPPLGDKWPKWAFGLGYAGVWPWSMVTPTKARPCPNGICTDPVLWAAHARMLTEDASFSSSFTKRREGGRLPDSELVTWAGYAKNAVKQLRQELAEMEAEIEKDRGQIEESTTKWLSQAEKILAEQAEYRKKAEKDIGIDKDHVAENEGWLKQRRQDRVEAESQLQNHKDLLKQARAKKDAAWIGREERYISQYQGDLVAIEKDLTQATANLRLSKEALQNHQADLARAKQEIEKQEAERVKHTGLIRLHTSQLAWKEPRLRLRRELYLSFWQAEAESHPVAGPVGEGLRPNAP